MSAQALPEGQLFVISQDGDGIAVCGLHGPFFMDWLDAGDQEPNLIWGPRALAGAEVTP